MNKELQDKIEAFITEQMPKEELEAFQKAIDADETLAMEVELVRLERASMHLLREEDLRSKFKKWEVDKPLSEPNSILKPEENKPLTKVGNVRQLNKQRRWLIGIAIAASILFVVGAWKFNQLSNQYTNETLFAKAYTPPIINPQLKSSEVIKNIFSDADLAFQNKAYDKAISLYQKIPDTTKVTYDIAQLRIGHTYFNKYNASVSSSDLDAAVEKYDQVALNSKTLDVTYEAEWYRLMILLKNNQVNDDFKNQLFIIMNNENHNYSDKAQLLESEINTFWYKWNYE